MSVAENVKKRIDDYWLKGFYQYKPDNTIHLKCDTSNIWLNNDQFYQDVVLGCDITLNRVAFELSGSDENIEVVRVALLNRVTTNLTFFLEATNKRSPHFVVEYENKVVTPVFEMVEEFQETLSPEVLVSSIPNKKKKEIK